MHNLPLTIEALTPPMFLLWTFGSLARFVALLLSVRTTGLIRKTARRGKRWLSNWRYVR